MSTPLKSADVTLRIASPNGPIEVVLPLWRPAYGVAEARRLTGNVSLIRACLLDAQQAAAAGNPIAPVVALRIVMAVGGGNDRTVPEWLLSDVLQTLEMGRHSGQGRHAQRVTAWQQDVADYTRYRMVELLRFKGHKTPEVYEIAKERLEHFAVASGALGGQDTIEKAYRRVIKRTGSAPRSNDPWTLRFAPRYYPDPITLYLLAAIDAAGASK